MRSMPPFSQHLCAYSRNNKVIKQNRLLHVNKALVYSCQLHIDINFWHIIYFNIKMKHEIIILPSSSTHFIVKSWSEEKRHITLISCLSWSTVIRGSIYVIIISLNKFCKHFYLFYFQKIIFFVNLPIESRFDTDLGYIHSRHPKH